MSRPKLKPSYILFYPGDWLKDLALTSCSFETRGVWMTLLCHMHESEVPGKLIVNGKPLDKKGIKKLLNIHDDGFDPIWNELIDNGVLKKDAESGAYFSKRMVNDHKKFLESTDNIDSNNQKIIEMTKKIMNYLNKKVNQDYNLADPGYVKLVKEKINNDYTLNDFQIVIDAKSKEWIGDKTMEKYLRPATLFGPKFGEYLNQAKKDEKLLKDERTPKYTKNPYNDMKK